MSAPAIVTLKRELAARPEPVFDAWLDPAVARHFLFATPEGEIVRCDIEPRVGGRFLIVDRRQDGDAEHHGGSSRSSGPAGSSSCSVGPGRPTTNGPRSRSRSQVREAAAR
jgi:uncharacterized protein YndB with AHSA1/START domain